MALNAGCLQSQDSWCEIASPSNVPYESGISHGNGRMYFSDAANGWIGGGKSYFGTEHWGRIYRTNDTGKTWRMDWEDIVGRYGNAGSIRSIHMFDTLHGWAVGDKYFHATGLYYPFVLHRAWIPGTIGIQWHYQDSKLPAGHRITAVWAFSPTDALIASMKGFIARTSDAGESWITVDTVATDLPIQNVHFVNTSVGWLTALDRLYKTTDGGYNWSEVSYGKPFSIWNVKFVDEQTGWIGGEVGKIRKTTNGGATWIDQWSTTGAGITDFHFFNRDVGFAVGGGVAGKDSSRVLKTTNGGKTWEQKQHPRDAIIIDIHMVDASHGYLLTGKYLYSYCGDELVSVQEDLPKEPCQCKRASYDYLGREVDVSASGMLLEYDPCVRKARVVYR